MGQGYQESGPRLVYIIIVGEVSWNNQARIQ